MWQCPLSEIVVAGHSLGGLTALLVNQSDPHVKGAILLDPVLPEVLPGWTNKPILLLGADRKEWTGLRQFTTGTSGDCSHCTHCCTR